MFDPITMLAALAPLAVDAGKAAVQKWLAPDQVKPLNVDDLIKMKQLDLEYFKTITQADSGGTTYLWVEAVRKMQRPFVVAAVLGTWAWLHLANPLSIDVSTVDNMASVVGFYLFGDRTMFYFKKGDK
jgi:hypothetical protein